MSLANTGIPEHISPDHRPDYMFGPESDIIDDSIQLALGIGMVATGAATLFDIPDIRPVAQPRAGSSDEYEANPFDHPSPFEAIHSPKDPDDTSRTLGMMAARIQILEDRLLVQPHSTSSSDPVSMKRDQLSPTPPASVTDDEVPHYGAAA